MKIRTLDLDYCSDHLKALKNKFTPYQHGGIVLSSDQVDGIVAHLEEAIAMAKNLEFAISTDEWNRRAAADRETLMTDTSVVVLDAFRNKSKILPFPPRGPNRPVA